MSDENRRQKKSTRGPSEPKADAGKDQERSEPHQTTKRGKTSSAKIDDGTRHGFEPAPETSEVGGASGKRGESRRRGAFPAFREAPGMSPESNEDVERGES